MAAIVLNVLSLSPIKKEMMYSVSRLDTNICPSPTDKKRLYRIISYAEQQLKSFFQLPIVIACNIKGGYIPGCNQSSKP